MSLSGWIRISQKNINVCALWPGIFLPCQCFGDSDFITGNTMQEINSTSIKFDWRVKEQRTNPTNHTLKC